LRRKSEDCWQGLPGPSLGGKLKKTILIKDIRYTVAPAELSGTVDGERVYFSTTDSEFTISNVADPLLCAALMPAMRQGRDIEVHGATITDDLLLGINEFQKLAAQWWPQLTRINISAEHKPSGPGADLCGSFFTGGADSSFTFLQHRERIDRLVFVKGIDIQLSNHALLTDVEQKLRETCRALDKPLVVIDSNIRHFITDHDLSWAKHANGIGLAAVAHALGYRRQLVPATHTYSDLFPWGSHPLLDHLLSTHQTMLLHDGATHDRTSKIESLGRDPEFLSILRVCWQDAGYNCGRCEKCVRTMVALELLGLKTSTFPPLKAEQIAGLKIYDDNTAAFIRENLELALRAERPDMAAPLRQLLSNWGRRKRFRNVYNAIGRPLDRWRGSTTSD